jgi:serine/threonine protein phosphatase PrpC
MHDGDSFCEACGTSLHDDAGAGSSHGAATPARRRSDAGAGAAVSDVGLTHERNEDAFFVDTGSTRMIAVVCDGVSSSVAPDVAARVAADAAGGVLRDGVSARDAETSMRAAVAAAQRAVQLIPWAPGPDRHAPSCTFVGVVVDGNRLTLASVGDSRAYWVGDDEAALLTQDDSWMEEQITAGFLDGQTAAADPRAHMITNWLGADAPGDPLRVTTFVPSGRGRLVLCTDGLWNYAPSPGEVAGLVTGAGHDTSAVAVAAALVNFALEAGGHDNVTVAVLDVDESRHPDDTSEEDRP